MKHSFNWLKQLSITKKFLLGLGVVTLLGAASSSPPASKTNLHTTDKGGQTAIHQSVVTTKTETVTEPIPFGSTSVDDATLAKGTTKVTNQGVNGSKTLTYKVTYTDGKQTGKELVSTKVNTEPVTQVTSVGTYEAPAVKQSSCDSNYKGACVPIASDVDCAGGSGNGPAYVRGPVYVIGTDIYGLDRDGDGVGCE
jgi:hypothetical protein